MDSNTVTPTEIGASGSHTQVLANEPPQETPVLRLNLRRPSGDKKVSWNSNTIDNEHMNKKKSKCCCIYKKQLAFGESSSESEDECDHCFGHVEIKKKKHLKKNGNNGGNDDDGNGDGNDDDDHNSGAQRHEHTCDLSGSS